MDIEREVTQIADKYRCEGYQVIQRPQGDDIPSFARGQTVDLVAYRGEEKVVVQVKVNQEELRSSTAAIRLAELVEQQPGWRFDLFVLNLNAPAYRVSPNASEPSVENMEASLAHAEQLAALGEVQVSCILSWATLEAAMRHAARSKGIDLKTAAPTYLLRALYAEGFLSRAEFDQLDDALKLRNALVHGMTVPAIDPALPRYFAGVAKRLLAENGQKPGGANGPVASAPAAALLGGAR